MLVVGVVGNAIAAPFMIVGEIVTAVWRPTGRSPCGSSALRSRPSGDDRRVSPAPFSAGLSCCYTPTASIVQAFDLLQTGLEASQQARPDGVRKQYGSHWPF